MQMLGILGSGCVVANPELTEQRPFPVYFGKATDPVTVKPASDLA